MMIKFRIIVYKQICYVRIVYTVTIIKNNIVLQHKTVVWFFNYLLIKDFLASLVEARVHYYK